MAESELRAWRNFLRRPRFPTPRSLLCGSLEIEIYTDARAVSPVEIESTSRESVICIVCVPVINGGLWDLLRWESMRNPPLVKRDNVPTYVSKLLWTFTHLHRGRIMGARTSV